MTEDIDKQNQKVLYEGPAGYMKSLINVKPGYFYLTEDKFIFEETDALLLSRSKGVLISFFISEIKKVKTKKHGFSKKVVITTHDDKEHSFSGLPSINWDSILSGSSISSGEEGANLQYGKNQIPDTPRRNKYRVYSSIAIITISLTVFLIYNFGFNYSWQKAEFLNFSDNYMERVGLLTNAVDIDQKIVEFGKINFNGRSLPGGIVRVKYNFADKISGTKHPMCIYISAILDSEFDVVRAFTHSDCSDKESLNRWKELYPIK